MKTVPLLVLAAVLVAAVPRPAAAGSPLSRLDSRLVASLAPGAEPVSVWVEFVDKGEQGPGDLSARLARVQAGMSPKTLARRVRAGVTPLVDYLDLPVDPRYVAALEAEGLAPRAISRWMNGCEVVTSGAALARLAGLSCVRRLSRAPLAPPRRREPAPVESEIELTRPPGAASVTGSPAFYGQTYTQLLRLNVPAVHDSGYVGTGVTIAMLDDGYNYYDKHTATRGINVLATRDFVRGGTSVQDTANSPCGLYFQHGEMTLSCIGGNAPGIYVGPAFGASFLLAHTEDDCSEKPIEMVNWLDAVEWADSLGADVISSSLGYLAFPDSAGGAYDVLPSMLDGHTALVTRAAEIAAAKGIFVVNSAGNDGPSSGTLDAPADACGDSVLAVGAVDSTGVIASFSSRGPTADNRTKPDVCAQGRADLLASPSGSPNVYTRASGTSFSCPLTAGLAACLLQARPNWAPILVLRAMKMTASRASAPDDAYGWGTPNGLAVLRWTPDTADVPATPRGIAFTLASRNPVHIAHEQLAVRFALPIGAATTTCTVRLYDVTGRRVRTLWPAPGLAGTLVPGYPQTAYWDGDDESGRPTRSGIYFAALEAAGHRTLLRFVSLR